ncbi:MAG TPA: type II toxin-antitoxin system antitoxin SocA domain-containing protein [Pyrinomonadaceae bacterium]|nr:type II toxin-antitoxin system antitoxin SocA domain-containing protein [Pyrinomonadaceae bacterium]
MVRATTIANKFIELAKRDGVSITNMQLQKLVYIAHGWCLALLGRDLIQDPVEAWQWGPVIPSLYHNLSKYGAGEVDSTIPVLRAQSLRPDEQSIVESVWKSYNQMSAFTLSTITHQENTPWSRTVKEFGPRSVIPERYITEYYRHLYDEQIRRKRERANTQSAQ